MDGNVRIHIVQRVQVGGTNIRQINRDLTHTACTKSTLNTQKSFTMNTMIFYFCLKYLPLGYHVSFYNVKYHVGFPMDAKKQKKNT